MTPPKSITLKKLKEIADRLLSEWRRDGAGPFADTARQAFAALLAEARKEGE